MSEEQDFMTVEDEEVQDLKATVGEEDLQKIEKLAEKTVRKSQSDDTTPVSANEILHADIKVVVRMLDAIDRRLERLEATAPPPPPPAQ